MKPTLIQRTGRAGVALACGLVLAACYSDSGYNPPSVVLQPTPVQVTLSQAVTEPGAGWAFNCAVLADSSLQCWGANQYGQLGNGGVSVFCVQGYSVCSNGPVPVSAPPTQWLVALGSFAHGCGLDTTGAGWCWGFNRGGQLGSGNTVNSKVPVAVAGGHTYAQISASLSGDLTCAITSTNGLYCWGAGFFGQPGTGFVSAIATTPYQVASTQSFTMVAVGDSHTCALDLTGAAWCWGANDQGQVGDATTVQRMLPVATATAASYVQIAAGIEHTCALDATGVAYCWGKADRVGRSGATAADSVTPTAVAGAQRFTQIVAGGWHTCALDGAGGTWCWGDNSYAQYGDGTTTASAIPRQTMGISAFGKIVAGGAHTCGVTAAGAMYCWGATTYGQSGRLP